MKKIKDIRNEINEAASREDITDLEALLKNPDPKIAKNYGGVAGYKKMIQSKIDKLKESTADADLWKKHKGIKEAKNMYDAPAHFKKGDKVYITTFYRGEVSIDFAGHIVAFVGKDQIKIKGTGKYSGKTVTEYGENVTTVEYPGANESTEVEEAMSRAARIKRGKVMKRLAPKIKRAKEKAAKKKASPEVIDKRAVKQAKEVLIKKWLKGKDKGDVAFAERERIEAKLKKSGNAINRIKKKFVKVIRKQEAEKLTNKEESVELEEPNHTN